MSKEAAAVAVVIMVAVAMIVAGFAPAVAFVVAPFTAVPFVAPQPAVVTA